LTESKRQLLLYQISTAVFDLFFIAAPALFPHSQLPVYCLVSFLLSFSLFSSPASAPAAVLRAEPPEPVPVVAV
jgi:hypothetical protein